MILGEAKILVVDDEPALREIFAKWLRSVGCGTVETAIDGEDALEFLQTHAIDLMITDVRMPRVDGISLVRKLGELGKTIPIIIFVSGFGDVDEREMYGLGVEAFLAKPLRMEELVATIKRALAERGTLWEQRMEVPPRQTMEFVVDCLSVGTETGDDDENMLHLGRGGFSARYPGPLSLGKVAFRCSCEEDEDLMSGEGYVRWRSRNDQRVGVEFAYLGDECRERLVGKIQAVHPRCFIPS